MKNATIMNINFLAEKATEEQKNELFNAVRFENACLNIQLLTETIAKLEKKIANEKGTYSEEEVAVFEKQKTENEKAMASFEEVKTETQSIYESVVADMSKRNENGFGNDKDVVRTVLRVLASWDNSKLVKYAIIPCFKSAELYNALETIHVNSKCNENGELSMTKEVKDAYKSASDELEHIIKVHFSLPFVTTYTDKTRVKLTAEDKKLLHDCYICGFSNKFDTDDDGVVSFKKRTVNTLVKAKKDKKSGETTYDYSRLASTICNIVIRHYFA